MEHTSVGHKVQDLKIILLGYYQIPHVQDIYKE